MSILIPEWKLLAGGIVRVLVTKDALHLWEDAAFVKHKWKHGP